MKSFFHRRKRSLLESVLIVLLATALTVCAVEEQAFAAGLPAFDSKLNDDDIKQLTKKYDKDGYYLVTTGLKKAPGLSILVHLFYFSPETTNIDAADTYVHEAFHKCVRPNSEPTLEGKEYEKMNVYVGNKKSIKVKFTPVFRSNDMVNSIPKKFHRSNRFALYVEDTGGTMSSDWDGVYGLLNEFGGYCWGMHDNVQMFAYRDRFADTEATWNTFVTQGESDRVAYAEFKYYILHYLRYAKVNRPGIYKKIMKNKAFKEAYGKVESRFAEDIATYEKDLELIQTRMKRAGSSGSVKKMVSSVGVRSYYNSLIKEIKKSKYKSIEAALAE